MKPKKEKRSFQSNWFNKFTWLEHKTDKMYCKVCLKYEKTGAFVRQAPEIYVSSFYYSCVSNFMSEHVTLIVPMKAQIRFWRGIWLFFIQIDNRTWKIKDLKRSSALKGHLFFSCHRKFHMNWTSINRSPVLKEKNRRNWLIF
jgi:hypothetical protein